MKPITRKRTPTVSCTTDRHLILKLSLLAPGLLWGCVAASPGEDETTGDGDGDVMVGDGDSPGDGDQSPGTGGFIGGDGDVGDGDAPGDGDNPGDGDMGDGDGLATPLPLAVDGVYAPSGFMGDTDGITITPSESEPDGECGGNRAPGSPVGNCHIVTYENNAEGMNWGGVFWQYPDGNWGDFPGLLVASGATKVTFQARGAAGGENVAFLAGMEGTDTFAEQIAVTLTTEWTSYEIDLSEATYIEVFGPFGWTASGEDNGEEAQLKFYIDDIQWQ